MKSYFLDIGLTEEESEALVKQSLILSKNSNMTTSEASIALCKAITFDAEDYKALCCAPLVNKINTQSDE